MKQQRPRITAITNGGARDDLLHSARLQMQRLGYGELAPMLEAANERQLEFVCTAPSEEIGWWLCGQVIEVTP